MAFCTLSEVQLLLNFLIILPALMEESQFLTYCKFTDKLEATEFSKLLEDNNIEFLFEETSTNFDPVFGNAEFIKEYRIKLKNTDFERADKIQIELSVNQIEAIDKDYYLFAFTDQELIELITKSADLGDTQMGHTIGTQTGRTSRCALRRIRRIHHALLPALALVPAAFAGEPARPPALRQTAFARACRHARFVPRVPRRAGH